MPPNVVSGKYEWDVGCEGKPEPMELGKCTQAPAGGDWGSHIALVVPNWRKWGLVMNVYSDLECKVRKFNTAMQDLNTCSTVIGFSNKIIYEAASDLASPPPDKLESKA